MAKLILSIETGIWWTKVALVEQQYKKVHNVVNAFYFRTPEHAVEDGYIRDKEKFANVLKAELLNRQIQEKNVIFSINSSKVITREITIPFVKDSKIDTIVESQAKDYFPMDVSGYTISYTKMGTVEEPDKKSLKLLLIAIPDNLLSNYSSFAAEAGLNIQNFEYIGNSVVSFIKEHFVEDGVVVQLEEQSTVISIISGKQLVFQRVSPYGYETSLASVIEHKILGAKDEIEAFDFLVSHDVLNMEPNAGDYPNSLVEDVKKRQEVLDDAYADVRDALGYYIRVVITALDYYKSQTKNEQIGKLYLAGNGIRFAGIKQLFLRETRLPIEEKDYFSYVNFRNNAVDAAGGRAVNSLDFVSVIGATIHPINAKPKELKEQESKKGSLKTAYLVFFASFAISLILIVLGVTRRILATTQQQYLQQRLSELAYVQEIYDENTAAGAEAAQYRTFDEATYTNNEQFSTLISQLEQKLPSTITVVSLTITGDNISINMISDNRPSVALLLMNMKEIPCLSNVSVLSLVEEQDDSGNSTWSFSATATYVKVAQETESE